MCSGGDTREAPEGGTQTLVWLGADAVRERTSAS